MRVYQTISSQYLQNYFSPQCVSLFSVPSGDSPERSSKSKLAVQKPIIGINSYPGMPFPTDLVSRLDSALKRAIRVLGPHPRRLDNQKTSFPPSASDFATPLARLFTPSAQFSSPAAQGLFLSFAALAQRRDTFAYRVERVHPNALLKFWIQSLHLSCGTQK